MQALGQALTRLSTRWVPDPFALAILLTLLTLALAWGLTGHDPLTLLGHWGGRLDGDRLLPGEQGFWKLLAFGMQMCLILVTGFALASTRAARVATRWLADRPQTGRQAVAMTAVIAMLAALVNWGLGLIVGALMARDVGRSCQRRGVPVHYPLVAAAGYTGLMVWHGGLSGTGPFKVTQAKDIAELLPGSGLDPIPLTDTVLSSLNLGLNAALLIWVPLLLTRLVPKAPEALEALPEAMLEVDAPPAEAPPAGPAERLERAPWLAWLAGGLVLVYLGRYLARIGLAQADVNAINLLFLGLGLILHGSPRAYGDAIAQAASGCAGIILQFPFYAGIMGLMKLSGLLMVMAEAFTRLAGEHSFAPLTFLSAGLVNLFVPSGGGQWGVQGPVIMESAQQLGVPLGKAVLAFAYGDGWTNMLQPFWALPLLAITGLRARAIVGYTAAVMLLSAPVYLAALWVF
ncbi:MAG: short-chain fatty acid transporter [Myxococcales bacterium]|nr:short-chain fatty acid transporter [Myxococcales bacterium]